MAKIFSRDVLMALVGVWGVCFLMMPVVYYTTAFAVYGTSFLQYDLPMPLAMRRTMMVFAPATIMAAGTLVLIAELVLRFFGRHVLPSRNPLTAARHTRRGGTYAVVFAAWCYFPVAYRFGPNLAIFAALFAAAGGILFYRLFDIPRVATGTWREYRRGTPELTKAQQVTVAQQAILDEYIGQKTTQPTHDLDSEKLVPPYRKTTDGNIVFPGGDDKK